ncbi:MAG: transglutaminase-like domain-containing protein [Dysgonamonadaceae bacterium]|nr:transglutaminase-like domain-containing protein [Dysgonamonadaceae bacterium]
MKRTKSTLPRKGNTSVTVGFNLRGKVLLLLAVAALCGCSNTSKVTLEQIDKEEQAGNFSKATYLIDLAIAQNNLTEDSVYQLNWRKDKIHRIALDFNKSADDVIKYAKRYYPNVTTDSFPRWEETKALEYKIINGKKMYFDRAASNLFRLDPYAKERKADTLGVVKDEMEDTLKKHLPQIVTNIKKSGGFQTCPVNFKIKFTLTLDPNVVPEGETVRCWLPFPREDNRRQSNIQLLSVNDENYIIAPSDYAHKSIYMQKTAVKDDSLKFEIQFSYRAVGEWFDMENLPIKPYYKNSDIYKQYTVERPPHIVFSDSIRAISERIVGNETNVYQKVLKIWEYIDTKYPWAGAREYSTIDNIPQYVIDNGHGDCGQVTLLFITLARYNGIPARWQSGLMLHPGDVNLHDWGEYYVEGVGWVPIDESFGVKYFSTDPDVKYFYSKGMDSYRMVVNNDYSMPFFPAKTYTRSDNVDFQRGELEWRGGNIYYDKWDYDIDVSYF